MNRPIILINEGCSMSTFTSATIKGLIKAHGYPIDIAKNELYKFDANPYYIEGMGVVDLLEKTIAKLPNICFKLPYMYLKERSDCLTLLKNKNARICFIERFNLLDNAICLLKDFFDKSDREEFTFEEWRKSEDRLEKKVDSSLVLKKINILSDNRKTKLKLMQTHTEQKEFIYAEDLCNLKIEAYENLFETLEYKIDKNLTKKFLEKKKIKKLYKHKDVIDCPDIDAFKNELKNNGFLGFWR